MKSAPSSSWPIGGGDELVAVGGLDAQAAAARRRRRSTSRRPGCAASRPGRAQRSRTPRLSARSPAVDRVRAVRARRRRGPSGRRRRSAAPRCARPSRAATSGGSRAAVDPVRAARQRQVAVAVDHARDDRRAAGVDDLESVRRAPASSSASVGRIQAIRSPVDEDAHPELEPVGCGRRPARRRGRGCGGRGGDSSSVTASRSLAPATIGDASPMRLRRSPRCRGSRCSTARRRCTGCGGSRRRSAAAPRSGSSARTSCRWRSAATSCGTSSSSSGRRWPRAPTRSSRRAGAGRTTAGSRPRPGRGPGSTSISSSPARRVDPPRGPNQRLDELLGATVHVTATDERAERAALVEPVVADLRGGRAAAVRHRASAGPGRSGRPGRCSPALELARPAAAPPGSSAPTIVLPSATGGTHAGLLAGSARGSPAATAGRRDRGRRAVARSSARRSRRCSTGSRRSPASPSTARTIVLERRPAAAPATADPTAAADEAAAPPRPDRGHPRRPDLHGEGAGRARRARPRRPRSGARSCSGTPAARRACSRRSPTAAERGELATPPRRPPGVAEPHPAAGLEHRARSRPGRRRRTAAQIVASVDHDRRRDDLPRLDRAERRPERHDHRRDRRDERRDPGGRPVRVVERDEQREEVARPIAMKRDRARRVRRLLHPRRERAEHAQRRRVERVAEDEPEQQHRDRRAGRRWQREPPGRRSRPSARRRP